MGARAEVDPSSRRKRVGDAIEQRVERDPFLKPYAKLLRKRAAFVRWRRRRLLRDEASLSEFANAHEFFGVHRTDEGWVVREWAPNATAMHFVGPFSKWRIDDAFAMERDDDGVFSLQLAADVLQHGTPHRLVVRWPDGSGERLPAFAHRVTQHPKTGSWDAEVHAPTSEYVWRNNAPTSTKGSLLIYEAHIGMAQEAERVGTFREFRTEVLPRIRDAGYDTVQLMALAEHPYYASFGYQVSSFFAPSSRFGTADELKELIDDAHGMGLRVLVDLVHSHCARNEVEGISRQDGSDHAYTLPGERGEHQAWGSRCFDYKKPEVLRFLLSNCRYWLEEFRVDGFRFDGVTSMLFTHHGSDHEFQHYREYFDPRVDENAISYLTLANELIHAISPHAITIAEDVSGLPGLATPIDQGGCGFDYRFAMGIADEWVRLVKDVKDEKWPMEKLWFELTNRRRDEPSIAYAESHDQAMVGDQTLLFRLLGERIYNGMSILQQDHLVDRGIALHKLIRLLTMTTAGHGYLNFMGNEFGHPEWIDFPREGNDDSFAHARRQWSLADDELLRYQHLQAFDRAMVRLLKERDLLDGSDEFLVLQSQKQHVLVFLRGGMLIVINLHPQKSLDSCPAAPGKYRIVLSSDDIAFGGKGRIDTSRQPETYTDRIERHFLPLHLPARTALVLEPIPAEDAAAPPAPPDAEPTSPRGSKASSANSGTARRKP